MPVKHREQIDEELAGSGTTRGLGKVHQLIDTLLGSGPIKVIAEHLNG